MPTKSEETEHEWWAPLQVRPVPEFGERINVGVVVGNGRISRVEFDPRLPRLAGVGSSAYRSLLKSVLEGAQAAVSDAGSDDRVLRALGVHFEIGPRRFLLAPPSRKICNLLLQAVLTQPKYGREEQDTLLRRSVQMLDHAAKDLHQAGWHYEGRRVRFDKAYPEAIAAAELKRVPPIERRIIGFGRDVIIGAVTISPGINDRAVEHRVGRLGRQFIAAKTIAERVMQRSGRQIRTLGIVRTLDGSLSPDDRITLRGAQQQMHALCDTFVETDTDEETRDALAGAAAWARETAR